MRTSTRHSGAVRKDVYAGLNSSHTTLTSWCGHRPEDRLGQCLFPFGFHGLFRVETIDARDIHEMVTLKGFVEAKSRSSRRAAGLD